jgi:oligoendopeptidase F
MAGYPLNWDLDSLYPAPTKPEFAAVVDGYRGRLAEVVSACAALPAIGGASAKAWGDFLAKLEQVEALAGDLAAFVGCHAADDAANKTVRQFEAALSALDPQREQVFTTVELLLRDATPADLAAWLAGDARLAANRFFLEQRRKNAALRLPKEQELLAADLAVDAIHAWGRMYDRLSGDLRITVMEKGELVQKSAGQIRFDLPERSVRQNNFYAAEKAWKTLADSCADALNHIAGFRLTVYKRLGLRDHLEVPLQRNRMTRETLDAMWSTITARKPMLLKYLGAKAKRMGLEKLAWYDVYAPLPESGAPAAEIPWNDACDSIIRTFSAFSPDLGDFARHAFAQRWVEAENRSGKRQGAFCTGIPSRKQTRVFMTYLGSDDQISTLAHELGHAYHSWVLRNEPLFLQDYPMNLAETASTFAEAILAEERLKQTTDKGERLRILDQMLGDAVAFLMNIHTRFVFENRFHEERAAGELTAARLSELMLAAQKETHLDALAPDGWYPDFWISKLHFYISGLPFYNFPYTFGYLLSTGLLGLAGDGDASFPDRFRRFLVATGCEEAEGAVASTFGHDLRGPEFWNKSLDVIERRVEEFVTLAEG